MYQMRLEMYTTATSSTASKLGRKRICSASMRYSSGENRHEFFKKSNGKVLKWAVASRRQGYGTYRYQAGGRYEGEWMNDTMVDEHPRLMEMQLDLGAKALSGNGVGEAAWTGQVHLPKRGGVRGRLVHQQPARLGSALILPEAYCWCLLRE